MRPTVRRLVVVSGLVLLLFGVIYFLIHDKTLAVFQPAGHIATKQRDLIYFAMRLSLIVVIPVFLLTAFIGWKYRATNAQADYQPNWDSNRRLETLWWCIPIALIVVLSIVTWQTSHSLDPYKRIESDKTPLTVQVIAMDWKWLFIYPDQNIASVNSLHIPVGRPINFEITSGGPMNSFWIPQLGGQVYAMSGMMSKLHLVADKPGTYRGSSANISGDGFSDMKFETIATDENTYNAWVSRTRDSDAILDSKSFTKLLEPSKNNEVYVYSKLTEDVFHATIDKFSPYIKPDKAEASR